MFDGSSIRGFQAIHESDMKLIPDPATAYVDPFRNEKTLALNFSIVDPFTDEPYSRDPRNIAAKAEAYLKTSGIADTAYFGPEAEFYVFDDVRFETKQNAGYYYIDSIEGAWNSGRVEEGGNRGYKTRYKGGYFPVPPVDHYADLRDQMTLELQPRGPRGRARAPRGGHRRPGRDQLQVRHAAARRRQADALQVHHQERRVGRRQDRDLHAEAALRRQRLGHALPPVAVEGRLAAVLRRARATPGCPTRRALHRRAAAHAPSLLAFTNPTVNSYHRLVPGFEAPVNLVYSQRNRSACIRIPITGANPKAKRIEFRVPDPSSNPYLAFSAMLMAGMDGIKNKIEPEQPVDKDLYELPPDEHAEISQVPASLPEVLNALEDDHAYLLEGGVFTDDLIETWIDWKRTNEVDPIRLRPHPHEFELYYDI